MRRSCFAPLLVALLACGACGRTDETLAENPNLVSPDRDSPEAASTALTGEVRRPPAVPQGPSTPRKDVASISTPVSQHRLRGDADRPKGADGGGDKAGVVLGSDEATPGYTLITVLKERRAFLLDNAGERVQIWHDPEAKQWESALLLPDGDLVVVGAEEDRRRRGVDDDSRFVERRAWDGSRRWRTKLTAHHNIAVRPDGHFAVLTFDYREGAAPGARDATLRDDAIAILAPSGEVVDKISIHDAAVAAGLEVKPQEARASSKHGRWVDLYHASSIDWGTVDGSSGLNRPTTALVALQNQNRVVAIDTEARKVVWEWSADNELEAPHDARFLPNGNVLVFDNGVERNQSRVIEVEPADRKIVWQYQSDVGRLFYTATRGTNQRLPSGNTLISSADQGDVFEVTPDGTIVWRFLTIANRMNKRKPVAAAWRYDPAYVDPLIEKLGARIDDGTDEDTTSADDDDDYEDSEGN